MQYLAYGDASNSTTFDAVIRFALCCSVASIVRIATVSDRPVLI